MKNAFQTRILAVVLAVATLAGCLLRRSIFARRAATTLQRTASGGWKLRGALRAERVPVESPAHRAGVRTGDFLVAINERPTPRLAPFVREMYQSGGFGSATYSILRPPAHTEDLQHASKFPVQVILEPPRPLDQPGNAADRDGLPVHRHLCAVSPLDRA